MSVDPEVGSMIPEDLSTKCSMICSLVVLQRRRTDIRLPRLGVIDINHTFNPINSIDSWNRTTDLWVNVPKDPTVSLWVKGWVNPKVRGSIPRVALQHV